MKAEEIIKLLDYIPYCKLILTIGLTSLLLTLIGIPIYRARQGDEISIFGRIVIRPVSKVQKLKANVEELNKLLNDLNQDSKQKTNLIKLFTEISAEIAILLNIDNRFIFDETVKKMYNFILPAIQTQMTKLQDNSHRVAIFVPQGDKLKILEGKGYTPREFQTIELDLVHSFAGCVFTSGERRMTGNVDQDPYFCKNVDADLSYKSLACVPVKIQDKVIGVLSFDGLLEDSFSENDLSYLSFFAHLIAMIIKIGEFKEELQFNNIEKGCIS